MWCLKSPLKTLYQEWEDHIKAARSLWQGRKFSLKSTLLLGKGGDTGFTVLNELSSSIIFGTPFLSKIGAVLDFDKGKIEFRKLLHGQTLTFPFCRKIKTILKFPRFFQNLWGNWWIENSWMDNFRAHGTIRRDPPVGTWERTSEVFNTKSWVRMILENRKNIVFRSPLQQEK